MGIDRIILLVELSSGNFAAGGADRALRSAAFPSNRRLAGARQRHPIDDPPAAPRCQPGANCRRRRGWRLGGSLTVTKKNRSESTRRRGRHIAPDDPPRRSRSIPGASKPRTGKRGRRYLRPSPAARRHSRARGRSPPWSAAAPATAVESLSEPSNRRRDSNSLPRRESFSLSAPESRPARGPDQNDRRLARPEAAAR